MLECSFKILNEVLTQAQQVGIVTDHYNYIITNLDLVTLDLEPFQYGGANITGVWTFERNKSLVPKVISRSAFLT